MGFQMISSDRLEEVLLTKLFESWKAFVSSLPKNFDAAIAITKIEEFSKINILQFKTYSKEFVEDCQFEGTQELEEGMNSPGILWDRLTILNCKYLFTAPESVHHKPQMHQNLGNVTLELKSVMKALARALPARNILLAKETTERQHAITPIDDSLWSLQSANIAMWINQDLLYTVSADDVEPKRLRDYIAFFSKANRVRNTAIENVEIFYTQKRRT